MSRKFVTKKKEASSVGRSGVQFLDRRPSILVTNIDSRYRLQPVIR